MAAGGTETGVVAVADRGDAALDAFCRREHKRLVGMVGLYCGDGDLAEELAQEALARLVRHWPSLPTDADAARWLNRVALNLAKSSFRTRVGRRAILERWGSTLARPTTDDPGGATSLAVRAAVAALPHRQRQVVVLRYFCDLPVAEVAAVMSCPPGTVKSLTSLAVRGLRQAGLEFTDD